MLRFETILHPTDFSKESDYAYQLACSLAEDHGASLILLHVVQPHVVAYGEIAPGIVPDEVDKEPLLERLRQLTHSNRSIAFGFRLDQGEPAKRIVHAAEAFDVDLIVMGTHGRTGIGRALMGSIAEQVLRNAPCPVLTVKSPFLERMTSVPYVNESETRRPAAARVEWPEPLEAPSEAV